MQEIKSFDKEAELWHKPKNKTKVAIVDVLIGKEANAFSKFYAQVFQDSPIGWVPITKKYLYTTRGLAQGKVHRLGYVEKARE